MYVCVCVRVCAYVQCVGGACVCVCKRTCVSVCAYLCVLRVLPPPLLLYTKLGLQEAHGLRWSQEPGGDMLHELLAADPLLHQRAPEGCLPDAN